MKRIALFAAALTLAACAAKDEAPAADTMTAAPAAAAPAPAPVDSMTDTTKKDTTMTDTTKH